MLLFSSVKTNMSTDAKIEKNGETEATFEKPGSQYSLQQWREKHLASFKNLFEKLNPEVHIQLKSSL